VIAVVSRRLLWMVVLLLLVSLVTFVIFYLLPSADPALLRAGRQPTPALVAAIRKQLGLDQPFYVQYVKYVDRLFLHFDLGRSYENQVSVRAEISRRVPATAALVLGGAVIWLVIGVGIGIISAVRRGTGWDRLAMGGALVAISAPPYWLGLVSLYVFSKDIGVVHIFDGAGTYPNDGSNLFTAPLKVAPTLFLPWLVLAAAFAAVYARFMRSNLLDVMGEDYIRTARAKGLPERRVIFHHGVRAAITPIVTIVGLDIGILLGGAILIEQVFNIPGIGRLAVQSILQSDLPTIQGTVIVGAFFIIFLNLIVDIVYVLLDPRVRY
jgi:peptide/nickel transport system permease protein